MMSAEALRYIEYVFAGVLFLVIVSSAIVLFQQTASKNAFFDDVQGLVLVINSMSNTGTIQYYSLKIPDGAQVVFDDRVVSALINGDSENFNTEVPVIPIVLSEGNYDLKLVRAENGVEIIVR